MSFGEINNIMQQWCVSYHSAKPTDDVKKKEFIMQQGDNYQNNAPEQQDQYDVGRKGFDTMLDRTGSGDEIKRDYPYKA